MATINPTITQIALSDDGSLVLATWANVTEADTCTAIEYGQFGDRFAQTAGTFGGATAIWQGSNDNSNFVTLNNVQGSALSSTSAYGKQVAEVPRHTRPSASGGTSQSLTFTLFMRRSNPFRT